MRRSRGSSITPDDDSRNSTTDYNKRQKTMKIFILLLFPLILISAPFHTKKMSESISSSVVKIFTVSAASNYFRPWQMKGQRSSSGTGVLIEGNLVLTAAHVVDNSVIIEVRKSSNPEKYIAKVKWISYDADLALLEVEDQTFFEGTKALKLGSIPRRQEGVAVYGYPKGGDEISITQGIISRIDHSTYVYSDFDLLILQIDAAINPGNSGGPALNEEGDIVGIAMQTMSKSDNIGYIIPTQVIQHFLDDIKDGRYDGFPDDGIYIQTMENKNLKKYYGMKNRTGVLVTHVVYGSSSDGYIKSGDVILEVDGVKIADDCTIPIQGNSRVSSNYLIRKHQIGDNFNTKILRDGKEILMDIPLIEEIKLIPQKYEERPRYYIFGGMVFMPLTQNYLQSWGSSWTRKAPAKFVDLALNDDYPTKEMEEVVFLQNTLSDKENKEYEFPHTIVQEVNGNKIRTFRDFVKNIEESKTNEVKIGLEGGYVIVIDKDKAAQVNERVLPRNNIGKSSYLQ